MDIVLNIHKLMFILQKSKKTHKKQQLQNNKNQTTTNDILLNMGYHKVHFIRNFVNKILLFF